ncbi:MAG: hypothetical protein H6Q04_1018, partial [Acidobacteria bacterium]|nr:hypothetical protein [Acidobacteriota bacterium]
RFAPQMFRASDVLLQSSSKRASGLTADLPLQKITARRSSAGLGSPLRQDSI